MHTPSCVSFYIFGYFANSRTSPSRTVGRIVPSCNNKNFLFIHKTSGNRLCTVPDTVSLARVLFQTPEIFLSDMPSHAETFACTLFSRTRLQTCVISKEITTIILKNLRIFQREIIKLNRKRERENILQN